MPPEGFKTVTLDKHTLEVLENWRQEKNMMSVQELLRAIARRKEKIDNAQHRQPPRDLISEVIKGVEA